MYYNRTTIHCRRGGRCGEKYGLSFCSLCALYESQVLNGHPNTRYLLLLNSNLVEPNKKVLAFVENI